MTQTGLALVTDGPNGGEAYHAQFESEMYDAFAGMAKKEACIGELAILADAA